MKGRGCFCFGLPNIKERYVEDLKSIMKPIIKGYVRNVRCKETVVGYEDLPVYREEGSRIVFDDRHISFFCADQLKLYKNEKAVQTFSCFRSNQIISICRHETKDSTDFFIITYSIIYKVSSKDQNIEIFFDSKIETNFYKPWTGLCSLVYQKHLCLIGGSKEGKPKRSFQMSLIKQPKWKVGEPLNSSRISPVGCVSGNCIFVTGGWAFSFINSIERFNGQFWLTLDFRISQVKNLALVPYSSSRLFLFTSAETNNSVLEVNLNKKSVECLKTVEKLQNTKGYNIILQDKAVSFFTNKKNHQELIIENPWAERESFLVLRERLSFKII